MKLLNRIDNLFDNDCYFFYVVKFEFQCLLLYIESTILFSNLEWGIKDLVYNYLVIT